MAAFFLIYFSMLVIIWVRYIAVSGLFAALIWGRDEAKVSGYKLAKERPSRETMWREARTSMGVSLIYALPAAILISAWKAGGSALYTDWHGWGDVIWAPISLFVYLILHDTYFYWTHRMMHHPKLYPLVHQTHHLSKQPTPWAAFSFHPWESIISAPLVPVLAFFIPMHMGVFLFLLSLMTFSAVANHAGWEIWPRSFLDGPIGRQLISARHHNLHHTRFSRNYGLYFRWWDKWMGTDNMSGDPMERSAQAGGK